MFPDLQQIKQIFHCVFFSNNIRNTPSIFNSSQTATSLCMFIKCLNKTKRKTTKKNLQNNPDRRIGWIGQNEKSVHFREESAERKNGHICKITTALHTPTCETT